MGALIRAGLKIFGVSAIVGVGTTIGSNIISSGLSFSNILTMLAVVAACGLGIWALIKFIK